MGVESSVLWIDEDQAELPIIKWIVEKYGGRVKQALSVKEAVEILDVENPNAILLDCIVRRSSEDECSDRYTGLVVFRGMNDVQKKRTVVLSVVPYDDVAKQMFTAGYAFPRERFFWKVELNEKLDEFKATMSRLLGACV